MSRVVCVLSLLFCANTAWAVPEVLTHQGRLFDSTGAPLTDGPHDLTFTLHDASAGGAELWTDTITAETTNGYFFVQLGSESNAIDRDRLGALEIWLGMSIDGGTELPTRQPLTSVPYAVVADSVVGGIVDVSEVRINGSVVIDDSGDLVSAIDWDSLQGRPTALDGGTCTDGEALVFSGGDWICGGAPEHEHNAADITDGTLAIERLPVGGGSEQVAAGDHIHTDYMFTGAQFATSSQSCGSGERVTGIDDTGALVCASDIDTNTTYDGADFAVSNQACPSGQRVTGIDSSGSVVCVADIDTNTTYDGADFALSNRTCGANQVMVGISSAGVPVCGGFSAYRENCSGAGCTTPACAVGDILMGCTFYSDPGTDSDDMDFSPNYSARTCSKGSNDPAYGLSALCLRVPN